MTVNKTSDTRVVILVFPFAAQNVLSFASKLATAVSSVAADTILVGGKIPENIALPASVQVHDIGVRLHYLREKHTRQHMRDFRYSPFLWSQDETGKPRMPREAARTPQRPVPPLEYPGKTTTQLDDQPTVGVRPSSTLA